jgi:hypothetical protein
MPASYFHRKEYLMTRTHLWQLGVISAAAGLICVAQAEINETSAETQLTPASQAVDPSAAPEKLSDPSATEAQVQAAPTADASSSSNASEAIAPSVRSGEPAAAVMPAKTSGQKVIVAAAAAEPTATSAPAAAAVLPITREEVIAEAIYANRHGLIPHGEMGVVNEDLGTQWTQKAEQARLARAEQIRVARLETEQRLAQATNTVANATASANASANTPAIAAPTTTSSATNNLAALSDNASSTQTNQR